MDYVESRRKACLKGGDEEFSVNPPLALFPEGTTSNGLGLLKFHKGAFLPGAPVLMVGFKYPFQRFCCAYESILTLMHVLRLLSQFKNNLQVEIYGVLHPTKGRKERPWTFCIKVSFCFGEKLRVARVALVVQG